MIPFFQDQVPIHYRTSTQKLLRCKKNISKRLKNPVKAEEMIDRIIDHYHALFIKETYVLVRNKILDEYTRLADSIEQLLENPSPENVSQFDTDHLASSAFKFKLLCCTLSAVLWLSILLTATAVLTFAGPLFFIQPIMSSLLITLASFVFAYAGFYFILASNSLINAEEINYFPEYEAKSLATLLVEEAGIIIPEHYLNPTEESTLRDDYFSFSSPPKI